MSVINKDVNERLLRLLYAQDSSIYQELPIGVEFPLNRSEVIEIVKRGIPIIPRGAGTSLAGQVVGSGLVLDLGRHMNGVCKIDTEQGWAEVEPGVVRDELNFILRETKWFFAPNTSTSDRCMIGGMVGNNSSGSSSLVYGTTRDKVLGLELITSEGCIRAFGDIESDGISEIPQAFKDWLADWREAWLKSNLVDHFPLSTVHRRNTGYAIDILADDENAIHKVFCGSEGTLGIITKVRIALDVKPPPHYAVVALHFNSLDHALKATPHLVKYRPYQLELIDKIVLECTKGHRQFYSWRDFVIDDPDAILLVEVRGQTEVDLSLRIAEIDHDLNSGRVVLIGEDSSQVWRLRAAGLGLLSNLEGDSKPVACIEDTAVDVEVLSDYIFQFNELLKSFGQTGVYYAHAGAGELHVRPILNLKTREGVKLLFEISKASADLVKRYRGSLSGEHGDGRLRAPFLKDFYGEEVYSWMVKFKSVWDPNNIMNPGKIIGDKSITQDLRYSVDKTEPVVNTYIKFDKEGGILRAAEKCNGSGDCRRLSFTGAMMCPSYMASRNEWDSTRGRANVLRTLLTNEGSNGFASSELLVAMKNCVGCKGCSKECPSSIDMALMRLEVLYQNRGNRTFSDLIFARIHYLVYFQKFSSLINYLLKLSIVKKVLGIDESRSIPAIGRGELLSEVLKKNSINGVLGKENVVILWVDEFTALYNPDLVQKSIVVLEALDFNVILIYLPSSRALLSGGFLPQAKSMIMETVKSLFTYSTLLGYPPILGLEPSATLSFNDEYLKLLSVDEINKYHSLIGKTWTIDSFLSHHLRKSIIKRHRFKAIKGEVLIHVHCHQKSLESPGDTAFVLKTLLGAKVTSLRSSCCGMAGSFGLKKENDQMSKNMFDLVIGPAIRDSHWDWIVATGVSCRQQVSDLTGRDAVHMVDLLWYGINYPEE